jgi:hypothetical protein
MDRRLRAALRSGDSCVLLRERLRTGEVTEAHVELAARLGDEDARLLFPNVTPACWYAHGLIRRVIREAVTLTGDRTLPVSVSADWAEHVLPIWEVGNTSEELPRLAIVAARKWANCPCARHAAEARAAVDGAARVYLGSGGPNAAVRVAIDVAEAAARVEHAADLAARVARVCAIAATVTGRNPWGEREWQQRRLAGYVLGTLSAPSYVLQPAGV